MFTAKFKVHSVQHYEHDQVEVIMNAVVGENDFTKYTPSGQIKFVCVNPVVNEQLVPGKVFTVEFHE